MFHFFRRKKINPLTEWPVDMHSHLIPGIDDGSKTLEESEIILNELRQLGMSRWITTPHVFAEYYPNDSQTIKKGMDALIQFLRSKDEDYEITCAAEYYYDEHLQQSIKSQNVLTFGEKYLLFETNMISEPLDLDEFVFQAGLAGYRLVMAHPERYHYLTGNFKRIEELRHKGVSMQLNMLSFLGYYSPDSRKMARQLTELGMVDFLGSDCHNMQQVTLLSDVSRDKYFLKAAELNLLNHSL